MYMLLKTMQTAIGVIEIILLSFYLHINYKVYSLSHYCVSCKIFNLNIKINKNLCFLFVSFQ